MTAACYAYEGTHYVRNRHSGKTPTNQKAA